MNPSSSLPETHWPAMARSWKRAGSPLRPSAEDVAGYEQAAQDWIRTNGAPRVLLLGVTPEIYRLPWPEGHNFVAVDNTPAMIEHVWPGPPDRVVHANWQELPLPDASRDLAFSDGAFHLLTHPEGQQRLVDRLHAVLAPGGRCIFRFFVPPAEKETEEKVLGDLLAGRICDLNELKLRLCQAMQSSPRQGVALDAVWHRLRAVSENWNQLEAQIGWSPGQLDDIDVYRGLKTIYHFVSIAQATELFCAEKKFVLHEIRTPRYPLGERCPILVFERQ